MRCEKKKTVSYRNASRLARPAYLFDTVERNGYLTEFLFFFLLHGYGNSPEGDTFHYFELFNFVKFSKKKSPVSDVRPSVLVPEIDTVELATAA